MNKKRVLGISLMLFGIVIIGFNFSITGAVVGTEIITEAWFVAGLVCPRL